MADFDAFGFDQDTTTRPTPLASAAPLEASDWTIAAMYSAPVELDEPMLIASSVNQNAEHTEFSLYAQLPEPIREAVDEWVAHLSTKSWRFRREALDRFAVCFADNFRACLPNLSEAEYDSLHEIGSTCLIEQLDDGGTVTNLHQARCYLESVHSTHQARAHAFLQATGPKIATVH